MVIRPIRVDSAFENPNSIQDSLVSHPQFQVALAKAKAKFLEVEADLKEQPDLTGVSPPSSARQAFFQHLLEEPSDDC